MRNILLVAKSGYFQAKVADFGLSHQTRPDDSTYEAAEGGRVVPTRWSPPEVLRSRSKDQWSRAADVWSFGCVIYEVFERQPPYAHLTLSEVADAVVSGAARLSLSAPSRVSHPAGVERIMASCLSVDPQRRPTFCDLHNHLIELCEAYPDAPFQTRRSSLSGSDPLPPLAALSGGSGGSASSTTSPRSVDSRGVYDSEADNSVSAGESGSNTAPSIVSGPEDIGYVD